MNSAIVCGFLIHEPELEYENKRGKRFLRMCLGVPRESGKADMIPVVFREDKLIDADVLKVTGEVQTKNKDGHLDVYVYAMEIGAANDNEIGTNNININGFFCNGPVFRTTPLGRKICDMLVASNRDHNKSDYIPCICWGSKAEFAGELNVGANVSLNGRFQSRDYVKRTDDGEEIRTAYEISCGGVELLNESEG